MSTQSNLAIAPASLNAYSMQTEIPYYTVFRFPPPPSIYRQNLRPTTVALCRGLSVTARKVCCSSGMRLGITAKNFFFFLHRVTKRVWMLKQVRVNTVNSMAKVKNMNIFTITAGCQKQCRRPHGQIRL